MRYTGERFTLSAGPYLAGISEGGARLASLTHEGRPLVAGFDEDELPPVYRGAVLAPWPNRIADGRYTFRGQTCQLPVNEPDRVAALHGLAVWLPWRRLRGSASSVSLGLRLWPTDGYPFMLDLVASYALDDDGLAVSLSAQNVGDRTAPYGCSIHPYLVAGPGQVDEWSLQLPASAYLEVDSVRLLPVGVRDVAGTPFDFRTTQRIGDRFIDHAVTGLEFTDAGACRAALTQSDGHGVEMTWDAGCRWVQLHTADRPEPLLNRSGLALEPMTCPPNAFQTGVGLLELEPGEALTTGWHIGAL
jgi:aldose 1-epimerase